MLDMGDGPMVTSHGDLLLPRFLKAQISKKSRKKKTVERWQQTVAQRWGAQVLFQLRCP